MYSVRKRKLQVRFSDQHVGGFSYHRLRCQRRRRTIIKLSHSPQVPLGTCSIYITLGQSPWNMVMCLVWQSVLLGND